ncbi:hypothetical protein [Streptomyces sp. CNQ085]|uniref:hypothetical protein n=1 Tax=Streptomyces sp. CNQ085 TaxID=2886944 RepID=UPI001F5088F4|nr:hypothetical protein [Streptomyces sp. CNQ085]MCI0385534.1 hypothetical protein [Streptomyces sp. CNQ085]
MRRSVHRTARHHGSVNETPYVPGELAWPTVRDRPTRLWLAYDLGVGTERLGAFPRPHTVRVNPRLPRVGEVPKGIRVIAR